MRSTKNGLHSHDAICFLSPEQSQSGKEAYHCFTLLIATHHLTIIGLSKRWCHQLSIHLMWLSQLPMVGSCVFLASLFWTHSFGNTCAESSDCKHSKNGEFGSAIPSLYWRSCRRPCLVSSAHSEPMLSLAIDRFIGFLNRRVGFLSSR